MSDEKGDVTRLLAAWTEGDRAALDRLLPLVYDELRRIAKRHMDREPPGHTLQPTALVNTLYVRLEGLRTVSWRDRAHFFGTVAGMMRRILLDYARKRRSLKRGKGIELLALDEARDAFAQRDLELMALDDALKDLARIDERRSRVVEMRFFAGLTYEEIGEVVGLSGEMVKKDFRVARTWLHEQLCPVELEEPHERRDDESG
jgi:RNA polymerase sigma factor (TIGR02999 family)